MFTKNVNREAIACVFGKRRGRGRSVFLGALATEGSAREAGSNSARRVSAVRNLARRL